MSANKTMTRWEAECLIADKWGWPHLDPRCCDDAKVVPCVCRVSIDCPTHGLICHGSHD